MLIQELLKLKEAVASRGSGAVSHGAPMKAKPSEPAGNFDVYMQDPYGNGYEEEPIKAGDFFTEPDGDDAEFVSASKDGKSVLAKVNGQYVYIDAEEIEAAIVPKGKKPE